MELSIVIEFRRITWPTKVSIVCVVISALLSLVSLVSPHWICAKEVDWPMTTFVSHRLESNNALTFNNTPKSNSNEHKTDYYYDYPEKEELIDDKEQESIQNGTIGDLTSQPVRITNVTENIPDLWQAEASSNNTTQTFSLKTNDHINKTYDKNSNSSLLDNSEKIEEIAENLAAGPHLLLNQTTTVTTFTLYADSEIINEEIEMFLYNQSDTSQLIRYTVYCGLWSCCVRSTCRSIYSGLDGWLVPVRVLHGISTTFVMMSLVSYCILACVKCSCLDHTNLLRATVLLLLISAVLIWTCIAVFVAHYFHQHMVLFEDRWLGWSFYIFPLAGIILLPVIVVSSLRLVHYKHSNKTEYLLDTVTT